MSLHHSLDVNSAITYGVHEAIIIHHFQYWIAINKRKGINQHEGKTWTYQTQEDIAAALPYFTKDQVRDLIERLCLGKSRRSKKKELDFEPVLMQGNFNKSTYDKTIWYAFCDEEKFIKLVNAKDDVGKCPLPNGQKPTPIPDNKPDNKTKKKESPSADALALSLLLLRKIQEIKPDFKEPDLEKWDREMDFIIRIDKREPERIKEIIDWVFKSQFWRSNILSPKKLREQFDKLELQKASNAEKDLCERNRLYALEMKNKYQKELSSLSFKSNYIINTNTEKDLSLNMHHEAFKSAFIAMFGGRHVKD